MSERSERQRHDLASRIGGLAPGAALLRRYTGQERDEERQEILASPPDVLLTNYVMLDLILTRPNERELVKAAQGLRFLVLDELHTYRGRQGAEKESRGQKIVAESQEEQGQDLMLMFNLAVLRD